MLLTGCSAGGLATYLHTDHVGAHLRKAAPALRRFKAAPDAGFFLMQPNAEGLPVYPDQMREIFRLSNASGGVNAACIAAQKEGEEFRCNFAENNYPHLFSTFDTDGLDTGIFVINSALDSYQTSCILQAEPVIPGGTHTGFGNGNCSSSPSFSAGCRGKELEHACNASGFRLLAGYERKFLETVHGAGSYTADVRLPRVLACASSSFATPLCAAAAGQRGVHLQLSHALRRQRARICRHQDDRPPGQPRDDAGGGRPVVARPGDDQGGGEQLPAVHLERA